MYGQSMVKNDFSLRFFKSSYDMAFSLLLRLFQDLVDSIIRKHFIVFKLAFLMLHFILFFLSIAHYRSNLQNFFILARNLQREQLPGVLDTSSIAKLERTEPFMANMYIL